MGPNTGVQLRVRTAGTALGVGDIHESTPFGASIAYHRVIDFGLPRGWDDAYIELESRNCLARWQVREHNDQVPRTFQALTGPAGGRSALKVTNPCGIWVSALRFTGESGYSESATGAVDPLTGLHNGGVDADIEAFVVARLLRHRPEPPPEVQIALAGSAVVVGAEATRLAAGTGRRMHPPGYSRRCVVEASAPVLTSVIPSVWPTSYPVVRGYATQAVPLEVELGAWDCLYLYNDGSADVSISQVLWRPLGRV